MTRFAPLSLVAALVATALTAPASAQETHPRRAFARFLRQGDQPVVLVGPDRAWMPYGDAASAIALCSAAGSCRPIVAREACSVPACPGNGGMIRAAAEIGGVDDYPEDMEDWVAETDAVARDPVLAPLMAYRGAHPDASLPPVHWITEEREGFSFELATHGILAATGSTGALMGADFTLGLRLITEEDSSSELEDDTDDDLIDSLLGDYFGLDLRIHVLRDMEAQDPDSIMMVGVAPYAWNAIGESRFRVPSYLSTVLLEMGSVSGGGKPTAFYFGWNYQVGIQASDRVALDARVSLFLIDAWSEGDATDVMFQFALGGTLR